MSNHPRRRPGGQRPRPPVDLRVVPAAPPAGFRQLPGVPGAFVAPTGTPPPLAYQHAEAFCLMVYVAPDGDAEVIWNSRDGVTPFVVTLRNGKPAQHMMRLSRRATDFVPAPGSRIFVDLTAERARESAEAAVERFWNDPELGPQAREQFGTREAMVDQLAAGYLQPGAPDLIEVPA
jgi:hypothetical protein